MWITSKQSYLPQCMCPLRQRRLSVMVWRCIISHGVWLMWIFRWSNTCLSIYEDQLWPVIVRHFLNKTCHFQDDNAPVHRARITKKYKQQNNILTIVLSPDISIIEHLWLNIQISRLPKNWSTRFYTFGISLCKLISLTSFYL